MRYINYQLKKVKIVREEGKKGRNYLFIVLTCNAAVDASRDSHSSSIALSRAATSASSETRQFISPTCKTHSGHEKMSGLFIPYTKTHLGL